MPGRRPPTRPRGAGGAGGGAGAGNAAMGGVGGEEAAIARAIEESLNNNQNEPAANYNEEQEL